MLQHLATSLMARLGAEFIAGQGMGRGKGGGHRYG